jgi:glucose dehydrogenase
MRNQARTVSCRPAVAGVVLVVAAGLILGGCSSSSSSTSSGLRCPSKRGAAVTGTTPAATGRAAAGWTQPNADLASTRDVASMITSADVSKLGVAWTMPLTIPTTHTDGAYAATPVIVNGVVYVQDLESNVYAISLTTGKVLWRHDYNSPNGGPDGVNVVSGVVYAATAKAAVALNAATGAQLWSRMLIGNDHEGIAMAPGYDRGTVYVSTVPANVTGQYLPGGEGILWALNAGTGMPEWSWNQVQNLWGNPGVNSGGGLWYTPSFDAQGNIYLGIANPGPIFGTKSYPLGSSRPGPDLYTDSVVKLSPAGKLLWYYQLTPHDLYDWDLQNPPVLSTAGGRQVVIDRDASLAGPAASEVLPRAEHLRRHPDPAGQQRLHHLRRRQRPRAAGQRGRLHRVAGQRHQSHRERCRRDGRRQPGQRNMIIAYKLGATGKLPDTVGS